MKCTSNDFAIGAQISVYFNCDRDSATNLVKAETCLVSTTSDVADCLNNNSQLTAVKLTSDRKQTLNGSTSQLFVTLTSKGYLIII